MTQRFLPIAFLLALAVCGDPPASEYPTQPISVEDSTLGPGDKITVRIEYGSSESQIVEREYSIDPSGEIAVPYIDLVQVSGQTPAQVRTEIKERLADGYLKNPIVWVGVVELNSKRVSVMGQVKEPNRYPYLPGMTILDAITGAGGFTSMARKNAVEVVRTVDGKRVKYVVPVGRIQDAEAKPFPMRPGDEINVPERLF